MNTNELFQKHPTIAFSPTTQSPRETAKVEWAVPGSRDDNDSGWSFQTRSGQVHIPDQDVKAVESSYEYEYRTREGWKSDRVILTEFQVKTAQNEVASICTSRREPIPDHQTQSYRDLRLMQRH